jgi:hypothetical protein
VMDGDERVGGVEADTYDVKFGAGGHLAGPNVKEVARDAKRNAATTSFRLPVPAQPVDATPSSQLIRQYFPLENRSVRLYSIRPGQGGVPFESTLANHF